ncbi:hypothetical protein [Streptomyces anulatus]|uniref:hypothetical protein n=2 Tax=Streptomyces anulatus TaxID=1892 RepID=UPI000515B196|nr:hypothetical protein [Streptomyces anulatus]WTD23791.1 hypothetical protein OH737_04375 [Streptomyces anulatus]
MIERRTRIVHRQPVPASRSIKRRSLINEKTSIQPCSRLVPDSSEKTRTALTKGTGAALPHLVDWCAGSMNSHIKRYEACIGSFTFEYVGVVVKDGKPTGEILNASWAVGQQVKLAANSATFTEQITLVPMQIDAKLVSVTLDVRFDCMMPDRCSNGPHAWDGALVWLGTDPLSHTAVGKIDHTWSGASRADTLDLSTKITAYSPVANPAASRWQADGAQIRCDKISSTTPGCTFHKYIPTWVMNFDKTPAAVAHTWLIQSKLPNHPGSKAHNKPMFFLPDATKNAPGRDPNKNRDVICPKNSDGTSWAHLYDDERKAAPTWTEV